jgi:hypothetical protein
LKRRHLTWRRFGGHCAPVSCLRQTAVEAALPGEYEVVSFNKGVAKLRR